MRDTREYLCGMDGSRLDVAFYGKCWELSERNDERSWRQAKFLRQDLFHEHSRERMAQDIRALAIPVLTVDEDGVTHRRGRDSEVRIGGEQGLGRCNVERGRQPDAVKHPDQARAHRSTKGGSALGPADHLVVVQPPRQRLSRRRDGAAQLRPSWRDSHKYDLRIRGWQWIERNIAELKIVGRSAIKTQLRSIDGRVRRRQASDRGTELRNAPAVGQCPLALAKRTAVSHVIAACHYRAASASGCGVRTIIAQACSPRR